MLSRARAAAADASDNKSAISIDPELQRKAADVLIQKLKLIPHHAISLKRNKYRVIRRVARFVCFLVPICL